MKPCLYLLVQQIASQKLIASTSQRLATTNNMVQFVSDLQNLQVRSPSKRPIIFRCFLTGAWPVKNATTNLSWCLLSLSRPSALFLHGPLIKSLPCQSHHQSENSNSHHWLIKKCTTLVRQPKTLSQIHETDSWHYWSAELSNAFNLTWPAVTYSTEPGKIFVQANLCYFTGLFISPINLANSKSKGIFLVTRLERLFQHKMYL